MASAFRRTLSLIEVFVESSAFWAAANSSSANDGLCDTQVPKTSKNSTCTVEGIDMLDMMLGETVQSGYQDLLFQTGMMLWRRHIYLGILRLLFVYH
jgi:hypothetical protein